MLHSVRRLLSASLLIGTLQMFLPAHAAPFAYVSNYFSGNVSVVDLASKSVIATIPLGANPYGVAIDAVGSRAYVTNGGNASVIDIATNMVVATIPGINAFGIAASPAPGRVYVADVPFKVIDTNTNTVAGSVPLPPGANPFGVAIHPNGMFAYVTDSALDALYVINTVSLTLSATIPVGSNPGGVALNPSGSRIYVGNNSGVGGNSVTVIDSATNTVLTTILNVGTPGSLVVNPAGTRLYVAATSTHQITLIDTATNTIIVDIPNGAGAGIDMDSSGRYAIIAGSYQNNLQVLDTTTNVVVAAVAVGSSPIAFGRFITPGALAPFPAFGIPALDRRMLFVLSGLLVLLALLSLRRRIK